MWLPAALGAGIVLVGLVQLLHLLFLPGFLSEDSLLWGLMAARPALELVLLGGVVVGVGLLIRWASSGALRR